MPPTNLLKIKRAREWIGNYNDPPPFHLVLSFLHSNDTCIVMKKIRSLKKFLFPGSSSVSEETDYSICITILFQIQVIFVDWVISGYL